jgi:putative protease
MSVAKRPEILAPAGSPACLPAAVAGGANAVYLGLRHFNARGRADNFRKAELPEHVRYLHHHGLKCYLVMNTLIHDDEYAKALDMAAHAADCKVDAAIIQDLGLWRTLAREIPQLKRHSSTQMTVHHASQIEVLAELGAERVILARELSLAELTECTTEAKRLGIETEHFVHGALCYAYSGQCLMSNFAGCRSANRGTCAQNCRFDYTQGTGKDPDTVLSMKDLALIGHVRELSDMGVASFKIEGRLKSEDYVYTTSRIYRAAVDAWADGRKFDLKHAHDLLRDVFSRGHTDAPAIADYSQQSRLHRYSPQTDRPADAALIAVDRKIGRIDISSPVAPRPGQGFQYAFGMHTGGFLITAVDPLRPDHWRCRVRMNDHGPMLPAGLPLFRNSDHERKREAQAAMAAVGFASVPPPTTEVNLFVGGKIGEPLSVRSTTVDGRTAEVASAIPLQAAMHHHIDLPMLREKIGAFGGTPFHLGDVRLDLQEPCFVPAAELKRMRRELVDALQKQPAPTPGATAVTWTAPEAGVARRREAAIWVAVNCVAAGAAAIAAGAQQAWLDDSALDLWAAAPPRIERTGFSRDQLWLRHPATARPSPHLKAMNLPIVAGHLGVIRAAKKLGLAVTADQSLNVISTQTLAALGELGASTAVISLECSSREIARLATRADPSLPKLAIVVHGRLPAMLTRQEHGLKPGQIRAIEAVERDGGLPYDLQRRAAGDTVVWEGRRLCCPDQVVQTANLVDAWILELGDLSPEAVADVTAAYVALRDGKIEPAELKARTLRHAPHGFFEGHLHHGSRELDAVVEEMDT